jgi:GGDEF domain-containing protein
VGHYFKLFSFFLVYQAIIKTCIEDPYRVIFRELDKTNQKLSVEVETRKKAEAELVKALADVKKLSGLLPICASCKNIRDDQGYWRQIEFFIRDHSEADFSHGICPDCVRKMYPEIADDILNKVQAGDDRQRPKVIASRNYFNRVYGKEWSRCARENKPLSLIIISFSGILKCGERLVQGVEDILNKNLKRPYDYLAGYEEETYAVILPYTDDRGIRQVADSILNDYVGYRSQNRDTCLSGVNIHLAMVTTVPDYDGEPQAILAVVEENLRGVKGKGIDQISQTSI